MVAHLKVFRPADEGIADDLRAEPGVHVRLGDLLPLVALAQKRNFMWLKDFLDDEVAISGDLHEVLQSFRAGRPGA